MEKYSIQQVILRHALVIAGFLVLTALYLQPVMEGKQLPTQDIMQHNGMAREVLDYRDSTGDVSLWTNTMFGGMPTYQIATPYPKSLYGMQTIFKGFVRGLPKPMNMLFLALISGYIMLLAFKVDYRIAIMGALAYGFATYNIIVIEAGHNTKALAIALAPLVIGGIVYTLHSKRWLLGAALTGIALAFELRVNHVQITYYTFFIILGIALTWLIFKLREKDYKSVVTKGLALVFAAVLGVGTNAGNLMTTAEYTSETTRGRSELTLNNENKNAGLSEQYATGWSYGVAESWTLLIPNFIGGGSANTQELDNLNIPAAGAMYWGKQPFVSGPVYVGAIMCFLFILGAMLVNMAQFTWLYWVTFLGLVLSWGRNDAPWHVSLLAGLGVFFLLLYLRNPHKQKLKGTKWEQNLVFGFAGLALSIITWVIYDPSPDGKSGHINSIFQLFFYYFPGFNKFRTVSMALVIVQVTIPVLGLLGLREMLLRKKPKEELQRMLYWSVGLTAGFCALFAIMPGLFFDFEGANDQRIMQQLGPRASKSLLIDDRKSLLRADAFRSIMFILLVAGGIWAFLKDKLQRKWLLTGVVVLVAIDMIGISWRYLNHDKFETPKNPVAATKTNEGDIMKSHFEDMVRYRPQYKPLYRTLYQLRKEDPGHYRVLNEGLGGVDAAFNDATTSYFHSSLGGYHGAKLKRINELINYRITDEIMALRESRYDQGVATPVIDMFNTKYFIVPMKGRKFFSMENVDACGNAWFVDSAEIVENADEEIKALKNFNPKKKAFVDKRYNEKLQGFSGGKPNGLVELVTYKPNYLQYKYTADKAGFVVFSEAFYRGNTDWISSIDGEPADHVRCNYHLRGMTVPAGEHTIEFRFDPPTYYRAENYSMISTLLLIAALLAGAVMAYLENKKKLVAKQDDQAS